MQTWFSVGDSGDVQQSVSHVECFGTQSHMYLIPIVYAGHRVTSAVAANVNAAAAAGVASTPGTAFRSPAGAAVSQDEVAPSPPVPALAAPSAMIALYWNRADRADILYPAAARLLDGIISVASMCFTAMCFTALQHPGASAVAHSGPACT